MDKLGKYEIISEIGRGTMGAVYKARDPFIGRLVALKIITSGMNVQANSLERFYQEARSAGALQHPNIVTIYELGHENKTPFIAMEYIEGGSLDSLIEQHQFIPLSVKLGYIVQVCEALSFAHRHNVIHRDVKPANIMVTKEGTVKVVDFGIARLADMSLTQPNMMIGSRAYMSPQLYKGERADARADIWAVGVTLYELLAFRRPFTGDSEAELMFHIMSDPPPALNSIAADCPEELSGIVGSLLAKKAEERHQSMEDVLRDLAPIWKASQQATVAGLVADCQQFVAANDLLRAQALARKALQIDVGNTEAKSLMEQITSGIRRSQVHSKVSEHLERGRGLLQLGKLQDAHAELEAALGLDPQDERAVELHSELDAVEARSREVEQKLRLTRQRLAEGALTEAASALGRVLEIDHSNVHAQELKRQIEEEAARREKRKKLNEILNQARALWTALNFQECLKVLSDGLREFHNEAELMKLQEMVRHDHEDLRKRQQLGEVRRLLGQQEFEAARALIDSLAEQYARDSAVTHLRGLVLDGQREQQKSKRLAEEMAGLRTLLSNGEFGNALAKGEELLREYPEDFELKEIVEYALGEAAQQEQRQQEKAWEKQIRELMDQERYREAEAAARRAAQELPRLEHFRKLVEEAKQKKTLQEQSERARQELSRRIDEIHRKLQEEKLGEAIHLAEQTLVKYGRDPHVTQLLDAATRRQEERSKKELQERELAAAKTRMDAGDFAGASQVLDQAMATQIFERSDPRVQQRLREIEQRSGVFRAKHAVGEKSPGQPVEEAPAAETTKPVEIKRRRASTPSEPPLFSESAVLGPPAGETQAGSELPGPGNTSKGRDQIQRARDSARMPAPTPRHLPSRGVAPFSLAMLWVREAWVSLVPSILRVLRKPVVLAAMGGVAAILILVILAAKNRGPSKAERELHVRALQLTSSRKPQELDEAEQIWRQLKSPRGFYRNEASQKVNEIENERQQEGQLFQEGETLLNDQKDYAQAEAVFQKVLYMKLWLADNANAELQRADTLLHGEEIAKQEQAHFDEGRGYFDAKAYDQARKEFQAARDLNVPNSVLQPQIDSYLRKIAQNLDAKKLFELALADIKNEDWDGAQRQLQVLVDRKGVMSGEAKQELAEVAAAQKAVESFHQSLKQGTYRNAKSQLDGMQKWPKTQTKLRQELQTAEGQEMSKLNERANALQNSDDTGAIESLLDEVRLFAKRAEDTSQLQSAGALEKRLDGLRQTVGEKQEDKRALKAAVDAFNEAKLNGDVNRLNNEVMQRFKKLESESGSSRETAHIYVTKTIPETIQELKGKAAVQGGGSVPPIACGGGAQGAPSRPSLKEVTCEQLDKALFWVRITTVEMPTSASQQGNLPYKLNVTVEVNPKGQVIKIQKESKAGNDFFKKAQEASRSWTTSLPTSGGKPVSVSFPLTLTFDK